MAYDRLPIGLQLSQTARVVGQEFDRALLGAGGSLPVWLVLLNLKARRPTTQRQLAAGVGIGEATLTHHLSAMERDGLVSRSRHAANRRVQAVALTAQGERLFLRLRDAAREFDRRLTRGIPAAERSAVADVLDRLVANVAAGDRVRPPWAASDGECGPATTGAPEGLVGGSERTHG